jgi:hypothetical protein
MITKENKNSVSDIMALMFKRTDLSNTEHYDSAHLKHKSKLFKTQPADISIPYLNYVTDTITKHATKQAAESVESNND